MVQKNLFEQFDDRYQYVMFNNLDLQADEEILRLVNELNEQPEQECSRRRAAAVGTITRFANMLRDSGDAVSRSQNTMHDNRIKTLMHGDIIFAARTGSQPTSQIAVNDGNNNPEDRINSAALRAFLLDYAGSLSQTVTAGAMYLHAYTKGRELLNLQI